METQLHPAIPREVTENLDEILNEALNDFGFKEFDAETTPQVYFGVAMLYFFTLGNNVHKMKLSTQPTQLYGGLINHLQAAKVIEPEPRNYQELREAFQNLFSETSKYLTDRV